MEARAVGLAATVVGGGACGVVCGMLENRGDQAGISMPISFTQVPTSFSVWPAARSSRKGSISWCRFPAWGRRRLIRATPARDAPISAIASVRRCVLSYS